MAFSNTIEWQNKPGDIIYKFPDQGIKNKTKLIVMEHQEAVFFLDGRAVNSFGPGKHILTSTDLNNPKDGEQSAGSSLMDADVFFINKSEIPNLKWGTKHPIQIIDPVYKIAIPLRAFGNYSVRINDAKSLLMMAIGSWNAYTSEKIGNVLRDQIIISKLQDLISETMINQNLSVLHISTYIDELSIASKLKIADDFTSFGIELVRFVIESINIPEDDESVIRLKKALAVKAEIEIMGEDDYKLTRAMDTLEKAAGHAGSEIGKVIPEILKDDETDERLVVCPECKTNNKADSKFCSNCGSELVLTKACPSCNKKIKSGLKFCPECGANLQKRICPKCKIILKPGARFCHECGRKLS